ncbi:sodium/phosphate symporter [Halocatena pleomorpha]|uniref:Sodium/phosphate symporter n=1 Tax=Halocatena pleomorpha TaxID=1785090 RepID=A0A3P3R7X4_9EURY|nr:sodium/phosphate symporter [Halocatena pleomorpha]RRJ29465.1 sodium/phosphate symporter [Halocatena pleomorpha]
MTERRTFALVAVAVFLVGFAMRTIPLYWSPLPFNLDGFHFAALARGVLKTGHLSVNNAFKPDEYTFTVLLSITSRITGISPLHVAQFLTASIGAILCLFVVLVTRGVGRHLGWSVRDVRTAMTVAGLVIATEGIFLGRSAAVSSEGIGHVLVVMSVFVLAYALRTNRPSWFVLSGIVFLILPLTHNLSTIIGLLSCVSLLTLYLGTSESGSSVIAGVLVLGFCGYAVLYYGVTGMDAMRISAVPGLFVAWTIVLVLLVRWLPTTDSRFQYGVPSVILLSGAGLVVGNHFVQIFPGTASSEVITMLYILPIAVIGIVAARGIPIPIDGGVEGYATVAMLFGSLTLIGFALTGGLTVEYQSLAIRGQTYVHLPFPILAGLGVVAFGTTRDSDRLKTTAVVLLVVCSVVSAPLAFSGLRATSAQPLVTQPELEAAAFASTHADGWTSDGHMTRLASRYYPEQTGSDVSERGVYEWLKGSGTEPRCPVVARRSWTTVGVQLFPASPGHITPAAYDRFDARRNVVYSVSGTDRIIYSIPTTGRTASC